MYHCVSLFQDWSIGFSSEIGFEYPSTESIAQNEDESTGKTEQLKWIDLVLEWLK